MRHHLKLLAVKRKISMAELLREVIEDFLTKNKKEINT